MKKILMYIGENEKGLWINKGQIYANCTFHSDENFYDIPIPCMRRTGSYRIEKFLDLSSKKLVRLLCE